MAPTKPQSAAGVAFATADEAAIAAIDEINPTSIREGVEYAGRIYYVEAYKAYCFMQPNRGNSKTSDAGKPLSKLSAGGKVTNARNVGTYHTHAGMRTNVWLPDKGYWSFEVFSPQDIFKALASHEAPGSARLTSAS